MQSRAPSDPLISVVIVNWNSRDDLDACIASVREEEAIGVEVIVVDNGSTDGSLAMLRREYPWVRAIDAGENLGFAEGCNRGIAVATGSWIFLFNNDAVLEEGALARLRRAALEAPEEIGMIQARIVFKQAPDRLNSTGIVLFPDGTARDRHFAEPTSAAEDAGEIFCPTAGAALYRHDMLRAVRLPSGILDRRFFMYLEDLDLGWRCRLAGYGATYVPDAVVRHAFHGSSARRGVSFVSRQCRVNRINTLLKNASPAMLLRALPKTLADVVGLAAGAPSSILPLLRTAFGSLAERRRVDALRQIERKPLESAWLSPFSECPDPPAAVQVALEKPAA